MMPPKPNLSMVENELQLKELQQIFAEIIRRPLLPKYKMQSDPRVDEIIYSSDDTTPHKRLEFYAQQYWWRIMDAFDEDFPCIQKLMTESDYLVLRNSYLDICKSTSFTLRNLGCNFLEFAKNHRELCKPNPQLIAEAIEFDWATIEAYDSTEFPSIKIEDIHKVGFTEVELFLQPYVKLLEFNFPIDTLVKSEKLEKKEVASNTKSDKTKHQSSRDLTHLEPVPSNLAIYRHNFQVASMRVNKTELLLLKAFKIGLKLCDISSIIDQDSELIDEDFQKLFQKLMALNLLTQKHQLTNPKT